MRPRLSDIEHDTRSMLYVSDGTSAANKLGRIVNAVPALLDAVQEILKFVDAADVFGDEIEGPQISAILNKHLDLT